MKGNKIASRYAQALLDLAIEQDVLVRVNADMILVAELCNESRELANLLKSPIVDSAKKLSALDSIFGKDLHKLSMGFISLIIKKSRESIVAEIAESFISLYKLHKNIVDVYITSAVPLDVQVKEKIVQKIKSKFSGEIVVTESIDEKLLGGFVVKFDDKQIDSSIASQLTNLKNLLLN